MINKLIVMSVKNEINIDIKLANPDALFVKFISSAVFLFFKSKKGML